MEVWPRCLQRLEAELPQEDVRTWLKPCRPKAREASWCCMHEAFVMEEVQASTCRASRTGRAIGEAMFRHGYGPCAGGSRRRKPPERCPLPGPVAFQGNVDAHYTFDNFVEGRSNQLGRAAAWQAALKPGDRAHNPLLLYGGTGLGKTHLMFAAGNQMRALNPAAKVMYLRSEQS